MGTFFVRKHWQDTSNECYFKKVNKIQWITDNILFLIPDNISRIKITRKMDEWNLKSPSTHTNLLVHNIYHIYKTFYRPSTKLREGNVFTGICQRGVWYLWCQVPSWSMVPCPFWGGGRVSLVTCPMGGGIPYPWDTILPPTTCGSTDQHPFQHVCGRVLTKALASLTGEK